MTIESSQGNCLNDRIFFVLSSTNSSNTNYKYVADVYVDGNLIARLKVYPDGDNYGIFEVSNIVRDYVKDYFDTEEGYIFNATQTDDIKVEYEMKFGEEYGGTLYTNQVSGSYVGYNYYRNPFYPSTKDNITDFDFNWLTERDISKIECEFDVPLFVSFFGNQAQPFTVDDIVLTTYDQNWASVDTVNITYVTGSDLSIYNICGYAIDESILTTSTYGYGIKITYSNGGSNYETPEIRVKVACTNTRTTMPLHFMNRLGGYDSLHFTLVNKQAINVVSKEFKRSDWVSTGNGTMSNSSPFDGSKYNAGRIKYSTEQTTSYILRSDWMNEKDYTWAKQLIASNDVYVSIKEDNSYEWQTYPVIIKTTNWQEKKRASDKMFNLEIEMELSNTTYSQFR